MFARAPQVLLFTRSLAKSLGYRPQLALYAYYLLTAAGLRAMSPPLALMTAQETGLAGAFRSAHQVPWMMVTLKYAESNGCTGRAGLEVMEQVHGLPAVCDGTHSRACMPCQPIPQSLR